MLNDLDNAFGILPKPISISELYEDKHFPRFLGHIKSPDLRNVTKKYLHKNPKQCQKCHFCYWYLKSENERKKQSNNVFGQLIA